MGFKGLEFAQGLWDLCAEDQRAWVSDGVDKVWNSSVSLSSMKLECETLDFHLKSKAPSSISKSKIESNGLLWVCVGSGFVGSLC